MIVAVTELVAKLRSLAVEKPDRITLFRGFSEAELDAFPVHLPEPERTLLGQVGAIMVDGLGFGPGADYVFTPADPAGASWPRLDWWSCNGPVDPGEAANALEVHDPANGDFYYLNIDRETGAWGPILACSTDYEDAYAYLATSLLSWWDRIADVLAAASSDDSWESVVHPWSFHDPDLEPRAWRDLRAELSPAQQSALGDLDDDTQLIDLHRYTPPVSLEVFSPFTLECRLDGRFAIIRPRD
ncbi:hypothetical protein LTV02_08525 [Nocardia yamanashiensis]|uniref:hypothetical protein n=1 Tax=Nocardia yamanashiensis TaxID=209247 RepID=UPI001E568331|nr:hypothetical protein [Nocardia yamanashiensis]UGT43415.1 hypothetical protein LTV02_08525 [Nocardia yamanashiensis]